MRQITITCAGNSAVADSYFAGYQGEHNATQLSWELSEDLQNYNYILAFALPDGSTESVIIDEYPIVYSLSQTITQLAGVINVQLTVLNDDGELIYKTQQVQLRIASSVNIDSTAKPYVSELTQAIEQFIAATKSLDNIAITAERNDKGVTISITDKDKTVSTYSIFDGSDYVLTDNDKQDIATVVTDDLSDKLDSKQDKLASGENIKTINNQSILGEGNLAISSSAKLIGEATTSEMVSVIAVKPIEELQVNGVYVLQIYGGFNDQNMSLTSGTCPLRFKVRDSQRSIYSTVISFQVVSKTIMNFGYGMLFVHSKDYVAGQINGNIIRKGGETINGENNAISFELVTEDRFWVKDTNIKIWRLV